jgi:CRP-like cAMP-binding protein
LFSLILFSGAVTCPLFLRLYLLDSSMVPDQPQIPSFLKDLYLFSLLDEIQISRIQQFFSLLTKTVDEPILAPDDPGAAFYIIYEGQVALSEKIKGDRIQIDVLVEGDFFGEDALLTRRPHLVSARSVTPVVLLCARNDQFLQMLAEFPSVKENLVHSIASRQIADTRHFNWVDDDEVIYQVRRRHPVILLLRLVWPGLVVLLGLFFASLAGVFWGTEIVRNIVLVVAAIILGIGFGWTIWNWIDWGNDYYVVTNQRVVWIELVIALYESRNEAPMNAILSINVRTSFLGRTFGFGDVIVTTYTNKITLDSVSDPNQLSALITEYWNRAKRNMQKADYKEMQRSVRRIIGDNESPTVENPSSGTKPVLVDRSPDQFQEPSFWTNYFGNIFKTRFDEGTTITYRKHWYVLLRKAGWSTLVILILFLLTSSFDIMYFLGRIQILSPLIVSGLGFVLFILILFPWWLYNYIDWRNDIYQVTDRSIFDIERRPFGTESKKSAALENILSLEHERIGFLGYILNVGNVLINVGEAKFTFFDVYEPARVQQDIFSRMQQVRFNKQQEEVTRERDRILKLLEIYHQEMDKGKTD